MTKETIGLFYLYIGAISVGMRAILPHVDEFRPVHNLESLESLVAALARPAPRRLEAKAAWRDSVAAAPA